MCLPLPFLLLVSLPPNSLPAYSRVCVCFIHERTEDTFLCLKAGNRVYSYKLGQSPGWGGHRP